VSRAQLRSLASYPSCVVSLTVVVIVALGAAPVAAQFDATVDLDADIDPAIPGDLVTFTLEVENLGPSVHPQVYSNILLPLYGFQPPGGTGYPGGCDLCPDTGQGCGIANINEDGTGQWYIWCDHGIMDPGALHHVWVEVPLAMPPPTMPVLLETAPTPREFDFTIGDWTNSPASDYITLDIAAPAEVVDDGSANPTAGCNALTGFTPGSIALIRRGDCDFGLKALNAEAAGAVGAVISNSYPLDDPMGGLIIMGEGTFGSVVTIPAVFVTMEDGDLLEADAGSGLAMRMGGVAPTGTYFLDERGVAFNNDFPDDNPANDEEWYSLEVSQALIFRDGFESGDTSNWSATGG